MFNLKVMRLIIVAGSLTLVACGQKGPLELPPPAEPNQTPVTTALLQDKSQ
ncbi:MULTISPECIES: LPS translocon maturation chaperone LptM [Pseudidiomarina]|uniref:Lipoprotein n=3 Tax=Pseudidiomarina TaxID=2800384 RepID=A0A368UMY3_9GAMM|nr:putative lipoprotein [Pseudidiomarina maritima]RBP88118.1 putative lipoprotein [Pseudidiomarina tainanensis]RCW30129.1 putative lipoprotein [Pseudidiomarina tainanensis]UUN13373.1 lipoprotein [Idiomarina loihiensis]